MLGNWQEEINNVIQNAKIEVIGENSIKNEAQGQVAIAIIRAYGDCKDGFIYIEPCTTRSIQRPSDVLLCHPKVGILVIEVKGWSLDRIKRIIAGNIFIDDEKQTSFNPWSQANDCMFDIRNAVVRKVPDEDMPLFNIMVAFPNIREYDWNAKGYDKSIEHGYILFREDIENIEKLRHKINIIVCERMRRLRMEQPIIIPQIDIIKYVFGDSAVINESRPKRSIPDDSFGAYIDNMRNQDKYLSEDQKRLSRLDIEGHPWLIRGVVGSGKTIVLANQVKEYLYKNASKPDDLFDPIEAQPRIAVVCFNRALVKFIDEKIQIAYEQRTKTREQFDTLLVTHFNGLMYELSKAKLWRYIPIDSSEDQEYYAKQYLVQSNVQADRANQYLSQLRQSALEFPDAYKSLLFDAIFVDEGQDFLSEEYKLLLELIKPNPKTNEKTLVIFYDDAQNVYARKKPNWSQEVGINVTGRRSNIMKECFRNTQQIVEFAFNILLGVKAIKPPQGIREFAEINTLKENDLIEEKDDYIRVKFAKENYLEPGVLKFNSRNEEKEWIASKVALLIEECHIKPEDILIIYNRKSEFRDLPNIIYAKITKQSIKSFILAHEESLSSTVKSKVPIKPGKDEYIFQEGCLTISTTKSAKGYDAPIVFLAGVDDFTLENADRASFYVGATRAKRLLYVTGLDKPDTLITEAEKVSFSLPKST
jgi:superfamily I DNA and RNA helicase